MDPDYYKTLSDQSDVQLEKAAGYLWGTIVVSWIQLLFPINVLMDTYFTIMTNRKSGGYGVNFWNELSLFVITLWLLNDWTTMNIYDP